jgi:hypothetical protein
MLIIFKNQIDKLKLKRSKEDAEWQRKSNKPQKLNSKVKNY